MFFTRGCKITVNLVELANFALKLFELTFISNAFIGKLAVIALFTSAYLPINTPLSSLYIYRLQYQISKQHYQGCHQSQRFRSLS